MTLTAVGIKSAKKKAKAYKLFDGGGLYLMVAPNGSKYWRLKYRYGGKEKALAIGTFPDISLSEARDKRHDARKELAQGIDPGETKRLEKMARKHGGDNTFEAVAKEWFAVKMVTKSDSHQTRTKRILKGDLYKTLGRRPIKQIMAPELLDAIRHIESRGVGETARKALQIAGQVFRFAVQTGRADRDPSGDLKGALQEREQKHFAAITKPRGVGPLMLAIDEYEATAVVCAAVKISPYVFARPGEIRGMEWAHVDLDTATWEIPAEKMKTRQPHITPLSRQVVTILEDVQPITGNGRYVFPSARGASRSLSENTVRIAIRTMGYDKETMTAHGFRAMARTILDEVLGYPVDWIEHQLAHAVKDANGRAYNRTKHLPQRREMMQAWADYLDLLKTTVEDGESIAADTGKEFAFR